MSQLEEIIKKVILSLYMYVNTMLLSVGATHMAFNVRASWGMPLASSSGLNVPTRWRGNLALHQPELTASNAPNTGRYDCKFVDTPPDKLVCQICLHVSGNPYQVTCCGRVYCKACLDEHKQHSTICPNCRKRGQDFPDTRGE